MRLPISPPRHESKNSRRSKLADFFFVVISFLIHCTSCQNSFLILLFDSDSRLRQYKLVHTDLTFQKKIDTLCRNLFKTLLRVGLPAWFLVILYDSFDQILNHQMEQILRSPDGFSHQIWFFGFLSILVGIGFPLCISIVILFGLKKTTHTPTSWKTFVFNHLNQLSIETLRSWGKSLLWGMLFIIPGIIKFLSYSLVPFVVCFSLEYQRGHRDALKYSSEIFKKRWKLFLSLIFVFQILIPLMLTSVADSYKVFWETPLASLVVSLIETLVWVVYLEILFWLVIPIFKEVNDELAV